MRKYADDLDDRGDDLWAGLSELGVPALLVPEAYGGVGLSGLDAAVVVESLGGHVTPAPFLASGVLAVTGLRLAGDDAQQAEYLPRIADGSLRIGAALSELTGARADAGVTASDEGTLTGTALFVLDPDADAFLVADRGRRLHIVDRTADGVELEFLSNVDRTQRIAELTLDNAAADTLAGNPDPDIGLQVVDTGRVMLAADTLGAAQEMLDQSVAYAKQREQFKPRHRLVPGGQAPVRRDGGGDRTRARTGVVRRPRTRRGSRGGATDRVPRQGAPWPRWGSSYPEPRRSCTAAWDSPTSLACTTGSSASVSTGRSSADPSASARKRRRHRAWPSPHFSPGRLSASKSSWVSRS